MPYCMSLGSEGSIVNDYLRMIKLYPYRGATFTCDWPQTHSYDNLKGVFGHIPLQFSECLHRLVTVHEAKIQHNTLEDKQ